MWRINLACALRESQYFVMPPTERCLASDCSHRWIRRQ